MPSPKGSKINSLSNNGATSQSVKGSLESEASRKISKDPAVNWAFSGNYFLNHRLFNHGYY